MRFQSPAFRFLGEQLGEGLIANLADSLLAGQFFGNLIRLGQGVLGGGPGRRGQHGVAGRRLPVPRLDARFNHQLIDGANRGLHLLVAEHHRAQHHLF